jgi:tRNA CCA-adding enzyme
MKIIEQVTSEILNDIKPQKEQLDKITRISNEFCKNLDIKLKQKKIIAEVFIGGSLAKKTLVKKDKYDVDIFVRFDKKYDDKISGLLEKILPKNHDKIHGSRDYFQIKEDGVILEIIPVIKIKTPDESKNVTDLSYFHVNYISKKIKQNPRLSDDIILGKAFAFACDCYGAESYINGFSGYAIELLVSHYGSFLKFIKSIADSKDNEKIIIDDLNFYKKKSDILREMNEAKILNPIILIDPTCKDRNALASLSNHTFHKFKEYSIGFLKNPGKEFFQIKDIENEMKKIKELRIIQVKTTKQKGDISGTKSKKFYNFFIREFKKEFIIKTAEFIYDDKENIASFYIVESKKPEETIKGPPVTHLKGLTSFRKAHPDAFIKDEHSYAKIKHDYSFDEYFKIFKKNYSKVIKEMSISDIKLVK